MLLACAGILSCMIPHQIIEIKVYILRYIWYLSHHCFNRCSAIKFFWWYHMYDLCSLFETKVPHPPRSILWHHLVMPALIELYNFNFNVVYFIGVFCLCMGYIDLLALGKLGIWSFPSAQLWCPINLEVIWYDDDYVFSVSGPERYAWIMRWCGLEQVLFCSNPVPTPDSGQPSPRLWAPNPHYLSPTRQSCMPMTRDEWNEYNRQREKDRHGGHQFLN